MRRRSPPTNSAVALLPRLTVRPSRLRSRFTPRSASLPPASPGGATARRSDKMLTVSGLSISICRMAPDGRWVMVTEQGNCLAGSSVLNREHDAKGYVCINRTYFAYDAITAAPAARSAGPRPQAKLPQHNRVAALKDLRVCYPRVRHVRVHARAAVPAWARPCAHARLPSADGCNWKPDDCKGPHQRRRRWSHSSPCLHPQMSGCSCTPASTM